MDDVGKHEAPVNGTVIANGHVPALTQFTIPSPLEVRPRGPLAPWPLVVKPSKMQRVRSAGRVIFAHRGWLAAVPVILVNAVAFYGQLAFLRTHLAAPAAVQALVAVALESIAIYLAWQAHLAQLADDSALRLRLAAYGTAALIGAMNYSHYAAPHWRPTFAALAFALCSVISPWLWSVHSRRVSRDALKAAEQLEAHAVRLGMTRWTWHPFRSWRVMSRATWLGVTKPADAIALPPLAKPDDAPDDAGEDESPDAPEPPQESASATEGRTPDDAKPKPRPSSSAPSKLAKTKAILKANPGIKDAEVVKRANVSRATVTRARNELAKAPS